MNTRTALGRLALLIALCGFGLGALAQSTVVRTITGNGTSSPHVSLLATPAAAVSAYAVEDALPAGLTPTNINEGGVWDAVNRKVKWGLFMDHTVRTFTYDVTGTPGTYTLTGRGNFDGTDVATTGDSQLIVGQDQVQAPTFDPPAPLTFTGSVEVAMACATPDATVCYTTNGSDPTAGSTPYTGPVTLTATTTLKARAFKAGMTDSPVTSGTYTRQADAASTVVRTITNNDTATPHVSLLATPAAAVSAYAVEDALPAGLTPTNINEGGVWDALNRKVKWGLFTDHTVRTFTYDVTLTPGTYTLTGRGNFDGTDVATTGDSQLVVGQDQVQAPTFDPPAPHTFTGSVEVAMACATPDATICYTTDGSDPTAGSTPYTGPVTLTATTTLKARAFKEGMTDSPVTSGTYTRQADAASTVVRTITDNDTSSPHVSLLATPAAAVSAYAVEDALPAGLTPVNINEGGQWDGLNRKVKWGLFTDHTVRTFTYDVTGTPGTYTLTGRGNFDGTDVATTGDSQLVVGQDQVQAPTFDPPAPLTFTGSVEVSMACATPDATICYTTDGSDPTAGSTPYTGPVTLTATTTLKARAFKADMTDSPVTSGTYTRGIDVSGAHASTGYRAGGVCTVTCTLTYSAKPDSLVWQATTPPGWGYASDTTAGTSSRPTPGQTGESTPIEWIWGNAAIPDSPFTFSYTLAVPAGESGTKSIVAALVAWMGDTPLTTPVSPDPLGVPPGWHSGDWNPGAMADWRIDGIELSRMVALYSYRSGTTRTGDYHVATGTPDGFSAGPGSHGGAHHSADWSPYSSPTRTVDWKIDGIELGRVVALYSYRSGTTRTGEYHVAAGTPDGFSAGPTKGGIGSPKGKDRDGSVTGTHGSTGYTPGGTCVVTCTVTYGTKPDSLVWQAATPPGWGYASDTAAGTSSMPTLGQTGDITPLEWIWGSAALPDSPFTFTYTLALPAGESGEKPVTGALVAWFGDTPETGTATPSPLQVLAVAAQHTVTFHPGAHGSIVGGTPNVVVMVSNGDPAPAAPSVTPDLGWFFTGWSPALPATITADAETTAQYEPGVSTVVRTITGNGTTTPHVSLLVTPAVAVSAYAVEDALPAGLAPANISEGGVWDAVNRKVKWGLFMDHTVRTLSYDVTGPCGAYTLAGRGNFDGTDALTTGDNPLVVVRPPSAVVFHAGDHGSLAGGTPDVTVMVACGDPAAAVPAVTPDACWRFTGWSPALPATITTDVETTAQYERITYTVTFHPGEHGSLVGGTPDVTVVVACGDPAPAVPAVAPAVGWVLAGWSPALPATITADAETTAQYLRRTYTLTYLAGDHGAIVGPTPQTVEHGEDGIAVRAEPAVGYHFVRWSDGRTISSRTDTNVQADLTVSAEFAAGVSTVVRTITGNGTTTPHVSLLVTPAAAVSAYAVEDALPAGLTPANISEGGVWDAVNRKVKWGLFMDHTVRTLSYDVTGPCGAYTLTGRGNFDGTDALTTGDNPLVVVLPPSAVVFHAGDHGSLAGGTPDVTVMVACGDPVPAAPAVTPDACWRFTGWSPSLPATITADVETTAQYERITYTVVFHPGEHGSLAGGTPDVTVVVACGDPAPAVPAVAPAVGWVLAGWSPALPATITADLSTTAQYSVAGPVPPDGDFLAVVDEAAVAAVGGWWHLGGAYAATVAGDPLVLDLLHDTKGRLTGTATCTLAKHDVVTASVKGKVKGSAGSVAVKITLKGANDAKTAAVALNLNLTLDAASRRLVGVVIGSVTRGGVTTAVNEPMALDIPAPMDGTWTLAFDLVQGTKGITGTALLTLSDGAAFLYTVKGKVADRAVALSLKADGADFAARGIKIRTTITPQQGGWAKIETFRGKGYGQTLAW